MTSKMISVGKRIGRLSATRANLLVTKMIKNPKKVLVIRKKETMRRSQNISSNSKNVKMAKF